MYVLIIDCYMRALQKASASWAARLHLILLYIKTVCVLVCLMLMQINQFQFIQRRGQDFHKKFVFEGVRRKEVDRRVS